MNKDNYHQSNWPNRREFLRGLSAILGATAVSQLTSGNALAVAFDYQPKKDNAVQAGQLFSQSHMKVLHDICAVVIPKTDTPSAAEVDVHGFIDHQLAACHSSNEQKQAVTLIEKIVQRSKKEFSQLFTQLSVNQQVELLEALEANEMGFNEQDKQHFIGLKALLVFGFFTTEVGATIALQYQPVPGGFKGSIPYDSVGKSYGSLAYY